MTTKILPPAKARERALRLTKAELSYYNVPKKVEVAMYALAKERFEPSGHGTGWDGEDFSMNRDRKDGGYAYASIEIRNSGAVFFRGANCDKNCDTLTDSPAYRNVKSLINWFKKIKG